MSEHTCGTTATKAEDEDLFSGFIDGVLTQGDEQRVRVRLESCSSCRQMIDELRTIRENARTTKFVKPEDRQWDESATSGTSGGLRILGFVLLVVWLVINLVWMYRLEEMSEGMARWALSLSLGGWAALLVSVVLDRMKHRREDRYRRVSH